MDPAWGTDGEKTRRRTRSNQEEGAENWEFATNEQSKKNWEQEEEREKTHPNQKVYLKN